MWLNVRKPASPYFPTHASVVIFSGGALLTLDDFPRSLVKDLDGNLIADQSLISTNTEPPSPAGLCGLHGLSFPMSINGTYQFGITMSWGSEQRLSDL
jgi:hypothetical protein